MLDFPSPSPCFPTCGCSYVLLERQNLEEMLTKLSQEEDMAELSGGGGGGGGEEGGAATVYGNVYSSATSMFVFIKNSIKRCTALSSGATFLSLCREFQTCLQRYCEMLRLRCPVPITLLQSSPFFNLPTMTATMTASMAISGMPGSTGAPGLAGAGAGAAAGGGGGGSQVTYRVPAGSEAPLCYLVNTGEYCAEVVPQLEGLIRQKMAAALADQVDLSPQADLFLDLVAHALKILVAGILDRLEASFRAMAGSNWAGSNPVGEESPYVAQFSGVLVDAMTRIREALSSSYLTNFCSRLASEVLQRFLDVVMRQKRISESGSQQLLLDAYTLKALLLQLHSLDSAKAPSGSKGAGGAGTSDKASTASSSSSATAGGAGAGRAPAPAMFVKLVTAKVCHIEAVLKLVGTPEGTLVERFKIMWPEGTAADLQSLMQLKGMKKGDQQALLEALGQHNHQQHQQQQQQQHHPPSLHSQHPHPPLPSRLVPPLPPPSSSSSSSQYMTASSDAASSSHPYSQSPAAASVLAAAAAGSGAGSDSRRDSGIGSGSGLGIGGTGGGSGSASDLRIAGVMGSGIAASASSYTAAGVKNLGDLSSTAAQNMKSIMGNMGNLVNRR